MNSQKIIRTLTLLLVSCAFVVSSPVCKKPPTEEMPGMIAQPESNALWVIEKQGLRMRETPDQGGNVLGVIPYGAKVKYFSKQGEATTISGTSGTWANVEWDGKKGWVFDGFLGYNDPSVPQSGDQQLIATATRHYATLVRNNKDMLPGISAEILKYGVRIVQAYENFAVVKRKRVDRVSATDIDYTDDLWVKTPGGWRIFNEDDMSSWGRSITLRYLNDDDLIDAVVRSGGDSEQLSFYLGKGADSLENIGHVNLLRGDNDTLTWGRCEKLHISGREPDDRQVSITFDCASNAIKKTYK